MKRHGKKEGLLSFIIACIAASSFVGALVCVIIDGRKADVTDVDARRAVISAERFCFEGHDYIKFVYDVDPSYRSRVSDIVHDPDCPRCASGRTAPAASADAAPVRPRVFGRQARIPGGPSDGLLRPARPAGR